MSYLGTRNAVALGVSQHMTLGGSNLLDTLSPSLLLQFVGAESLDPRITFTRSTTATYFNSAGVLTTTGFNLLTYSEQFDNAAWVKSNASITANATIAPNGTLTGETLVENTATSNHIAFQQISTQAAGPYTYTLYAKPAGRTQLRIAQTITTNYSIDFDLTALIVTNSVGGATGTLTAVGNGWYRCSMSFTTVASIALVMAIYPLVSGTPTYTGDGVSGIFVWGAQLETGTVATTYIPTQASASGAPRFDYDPVTLASLGLLIEEQRTNLVTYSEQFDNAAWTKTNSSITANTVIAPDGALTGDKIVSTSGSLGLIVQSVSQTSGTSYALSVFAKAGEYSFCQLRINTSVSSITRAYFNLSNGTTTGVANCTASITPVGNGWYRCSIVYTATVTTAAGGQRIYGQVDAIDTAGDGTSGIYIWGAQLEAGAFATSYIPTVASQVTRAADVAVMTGTNFSDWYNQPEGTFYVSSDYVLVAGGNYRFDITDGTTSNLIRLRSAPSGTTQSRFEVTTLGVTQTTLSPSTTNLALNKDAVAYIFDSAAAVVNGGTVTVDTSITVPVVNQMAIGATRLGANILNGHIRQIVYYSRRLDNAELQAITA